MEVGTESLLSVYSEGCPGVGVKSRAEFYKQDIHISPWSVQIVQDEYEVQTYLLFRQTAGGPVKAFR